MLKGGITEIIQKYDIDASVIVKYGDKIMYQHQADKIFPSLKGHEKQWPLKRWPVEQYL